MKLTKAKSAIAVIILFGAVSAYYALKGRIPFEQQRPAVNDTAPAISLADLSGAMVSLSDLRGKIVLINFWASWCQPCKAELKEFQKVYEAYEDRGFVVIGIGLDDISPAIVRELGISFPVLRTNERVTRDYGDIRDVPVSFLIGKDGKVIKKLKEVYHGEDLKRDLENAL